MDIALALEKLIPGALYGGSVSLNTEAAYDSIRWEDERAKPTWAAIEAAGATVETQMAAQKLATLAQVAIERSDITVLRSVEHGIAVPSEWQAYRAELRAIISGTSTATELPSMPDYPEGT
jgi:hypothetical protein